jgi:hypothetical protein
MAPVGRRSRRRPRAIASGSGLARTMTVVGGSAGTGWERSARQSRRSRKIRSQRMDRAQCTSPFHFMLRSFGRVPVPGYSPASSALRRARSKTPPRSGKRPARPGTWRRATAVRVPLRVFDRKAVEGRDSSARERMVPAARARTTLFPMSGGAVRVITRDSQAARGARPRVCTARHEHHRRSHAQSTPAPRLPAALVVGIAFAAGERRKVSEDALSRRITEYRLRTGCV